MQKRELMECALITFLKQKTGGYQPPVIFFAKIEGKRKKQPYWVASFLARVDKKDAICDKVLTKKMSLYLLEFV